MKFGVIAINVGVGDPEQIITTAETAEDRERIRNEHHEQMKERAQNQGVSIPNDPPDRGMRRGMGSGGGMGQGGRNR